MLSRKSPRDMLNPWTITSYEICDTAFFLGVFARDDHKSPHYTDNGHKINILWDTD